MSKTIKIVNDKMQQGYNCTLSEPQGRNFAPRFESELTAMDMLRLGVFGGKYMTDARDEFPESWFADAKLSPKGCDDPLLSWTQIAWRGRAADRSVERYAPARVSSATELRARQFLLPATTAPSPSPLGIRQQANLTVGAGITGLDIETALGVSVNVMFE